MKRNYYFGSYIMYYQSSINLNAFYFIFYGERVSRGYSPFSIIYRNYIVTKQSFETIKQINISSLWGSSFDCWYGDFCHVKFESLRLEFHRRIWRRRRRSEEFEEKRTHSLKNLKKTKEPTVWRIRRKKNHGKTKPLEEKNPPMEDEEDQRTHGGKRWT